MTCVNDWIHDGPMVVFVSLHITLLHYHHYADVSESIELQKCLLGTFYILTFYSLIHGAVCIHLTQFSCNDCENWCILYLIIVLKSEVWTICNCLGVGHEMMVCFVCLSMFFLYCAKPLSTKAIYKTSFLMHICLMRPQWVNRRKVEAYFLIQLV